MQSISNNVILQTTLRRSLSDHKTPSYLAYYVCGVVHLTDVSTHYFLSPASSLQFSFTALSSPNKKLLNSLSYIQEPTSYSKATSRLTESYGG